MSFFLDAPWDKPAGIDVNKPIDEVIEQIIGYLPSAQNIKLDVRTKKLANLGQIEPDFFEKKKTGESETDEQERIGTLSAYSERSGFASLYGVGQACYC